MTTEAKAKAYDEALERARKIHNEILNNELVGFPEQIREIFPQLRESEDERIRKWIISLLGSFRTKDRSTECLQKLDEAIAYLEKQKENIEKEYVFRPLAGTDITIAAEQAIRRVMEGDHLVLAFNGWYVPVDKHATTKGLVDSYDTFIEEQKEQKPNPLYGSTEEYYREAYYDQPEKEQKPAEWSEEDSDNLERVDNYLWMLDDYVGDDCAMPQGKTDKIRGNIQGILSPWLKSLPQRFNIQPKQEWSEEDETRLTNTLIMLKEYAIHHYSKDDVEKSVDWLENRLKFFRSPQDRCKDCPHRGDMFLLTQGIKSGKHELANEFMNYLDENRPEGKMSLSNAECKDIDKAFNECDWANIIRYVEKYSPSWKPSEEQMKILEKAVAFFKTEWTGTKIKEALNLESLYEQLKKL